MAQGGRRIWFATAALVALAGCSKATPAGVSLPQSEPPPSVASPALAPPTTVARAVVTAPTTVPTGRSVTDQALTAPFAQVGDVTLLHPAARVERVGFHESGHEGARHLNVLPTAILPMVQESRGRLTDPQTAVDIVVDPDGEIRAPVTGTVKRAGTYVLYCKYSDDYLVIRPDAHPEWEVKLLHIDGVQVRAGERVVAGQTVVAPRPTRLPFESAIDHFTADPAWPHVHIEVVDPRIRNKPSPGGGGC